MDRKQQQQQGKSVLEDKERFERTQSDQKLAHMGDKPRKRSEGSSASAPTKKQER
jgi:hypothetical protein